MKIDYIWGLFATDGSLYKEKRNGVEIETKKRLKITLIQEDVIKKVAKTLKNLGFTPKIFSCGYVTKSGDKRNTWNIRLNKQKEIERFISLEPKEMTKEFLFGIIDGDGCFRWYNYHGNRKPLPMFNFHCTKERKIKLFKKVKKFLEDKFSIEINEYKYKNGQYHFTITNDYNKIAKICKNKTLVKLPL